MIRLAYTVVAKAGYPSVGPLTESDLNSYGQIPLTPQDPSYVAMIYIYIVNVDNIVFAMRSIVGTSGGGVFCEFG